ncbi:MAG: hypothetical protein GY809_30960 [Planctomycetes bacterium]|nr:hypothetical protein [Planctomycetota bacterium]
MRTRLFISNPESPVQYWSLLGLSILGLIFAMAGQATFAQSIRTSRDANPKIVFGQFPPDFELPRLRFDTNDQGKPVGVISETDTIRLSSFRGNKPVCLIMSSYT